MSWVRCRVSQPVVRRWHELGAQLQPSPRLGGSAWIAGVFRGGGAHEPPPSVLGARSASGLKVPHNVVGYITGDDRRVAND